MVDRHGKGGLVIVGVLHDHLRNLELLHEFPGHGHADQAASVDRHEIDVLSGGELGGADEIALVFTVRVVDDQDDLSRGKIPQGICDTAEVIHVRFLLRIRILQAFRG